MSWNYRIMRHEPVAAGGPMSYGLHEVYYNKQGKPFAWTTESVCGHFDEPKDLIKALSMMLKDARKSQEEILDYAMEPAEGPWEEVD